MVALLAAGSCSRAYVRVPAAGDRVAAGEPLSVSYLVGDFGRPEQPFRELTEAMGRDVEGLASAGLRSAPMILELGDNLYDDGLPHDLDAPGARAEVEKLRAIAAGFARIRFRGAPVPLVLIPGNHDYADNALVNENNLGDISRWYFLDELGIEGVESWRHVPGDAASFADAAALYAHLDGDPEAHTEFMMPSPVPYVGDDMGIVAIDSELLLDLYDRGRDDLAAAYWQALGRELDALPAGAWRVVASHHPPVTYGKHGEPSLGNWILGQGWPQFPSAWHKAMAVAVPLGIAAAIVVHPVALAIAGVPPASTALLARRKQDVGSEPYERYAAELLRVAEQRGVDAIFAGHDHNAQLIELEAAEGYDGGALLVITGAGSKVDPVRRGPGTVAFLSDYSFVRLTQYADGLAFEIVDRHGDNRFRYALARR